MISSASAMRHRTKARCREKSAGYPALRLQGSPESLCLTMGILFPELEGDTAVSAPLRSALPECYSGIRETATPLGIALHFFKSVSKAQAILVTATVVPTRALLLCWFRSKLSGIQDDVGFSPRNFLLYRIPKQHTAASHEPGGV